MYINSVIYCYIINIAVYYHIRIYTSKKLKKPQPLKREYMGKIAKQAVLF